MNLTRIHEIEISSRCNLACVYCPHPKMERAKIDMTWETFMRAMQWVTYFREYGDNQTELAFTGIGEALLHPDFEQMLTTARSLYDGFIHFSTNGILFSERWAEVCRFLRIGVYISMHRPEIAVPAKLIAERYGVLAGENHAFVDSSINWAGTVDWHVSAKKARCMYLSDGWGVVRANGDVTTCCMDAEGVNTIGHVDYVLGTIETGPKALCANCHLEVTQL